MGNGEWTEKHDKDNTGKITGILGTILGGASLTSIVSSKISETAKDLVGTIKEGFNNQNNNSNNNNNSCGTGVLETIVSVAAPLIVASKNSNEGHHHRVREEREDDRELAEAKTRIAKLESEKYTDNKTLESFKETVTLFRAEDQKIADVVKDTANGFVKTNEKIAKLEAEVECLKQKLDLEKKAVYREIDNVDSSLSKSIEYEAELRKLGDKDVACAVKSQNYVRGKVKIEASQICFDNDNNLNSN